jgi:chromosome segregation ATPase
VLAVARQRQLEETISERDFKSQLAAERQDLADQIAKTNHENLQLANHLRVQLEEVSQQRDRALQNVSQYLESIGRLNADLDAQRSLAEQRLSDLQAAIAKDEVEARLAVELQTLNEQLKRTGDENFRLASDLRIQIDELAKERDAAVRDIAQHTQLIEQLTAERDTQIDLASRRQQQLEEALVECRVQTQLSVEQRKIADQLATSRDERSRELSELQAKLAQAQATIQERSNRVNALEAERTELQARQMRLDQEMLKAEAQIELIKDVILREKAF